MSTIGEMVKSVVTIPALGNALLSRHPENPIVSPTDIPGGAAAVFNSGVVHRHDRFIMLVNLWDRQWRPRFHAAFSHDGVHFQIQSQPLILPPEEYPYVKHEGIFDTRLTWIEDWCYITYNVASRLGGRIMLARTRNFHEVETMGFITAPDHRNCVLFPRKINGMFARLERPNVDGAGDIYLSYSPDLIHWGQTVLVLERNRRYWESAKIGPGAPPLWTEQGWLCFYHGARQGMNGYIYNGGVMLLDQNDPSRIVGKCDEPVLMPETDYERQGITPNVVFPTAAIMPEKDGQIWVYYGAADTSMALAIGDLSTLIAACLA
ncbi:MAG: glycosidase [Phycisphaerales bacterium]|nr:glycosidase [Phycisphaerales bacterium]